jgi:uroporphyrinogen-III synthase
MHNHGMASETASGFGGLKVLSLESRRASEMAKLIATAGGQPLVAPSMREVPIESNQEALRFAEVLFAGGVDAVIFLTGVGTRALAKVVESRYPRERFAAALSQIPVIARGPKPAAALRELGVPVSLAVPEPNTWRELVEALDQGADSIALANKTVAVQEYGESNTELLTALRRRGANVMPVPVYEWDLPEDLEPLRAAIRAVAAGEVDVMLFTTSTQVRHFMQIASQMSFASAVQQAAKRAVVGSIGPITSDELRNEGFPVDLEPTHPKMGFLVKEASERCQEILRRKRR